MCTRDFLEILDGGYDDAPLRGTAVFTHVYLWPGLCFIYSLTYVYAVIQG